MTVRIGIVSDTHGRVDPALPSLLAGCDALLHAGDVGDPTVLRALAAVAPLHAVRGNNDGAPGLRTLPEWVLVELSGLRAVVLHEAAPRSPSAALRRILDRTRAEIVVHGHSHRPGAEVVGGRLFLNPGSAGPRRFSLPRTACIAVVEDRRIEVRFLDLSGSRPAPHGDPFAAVL